MDRDSQPHRSRPPSRAAQDRVEGVRVAEVVAERDDRAGPVALDQAAPPPRPCRRRPRAAGPPRIDRDTARARGRRDRAAASTPPIASNTAARAAGMSSAWRTWNATDAPLRSTNSHGGRPSSSATPEASASAVTPWRLECRARRRRRSTLGRPATLEPRRLQPVVAEVLDATDPRPGRDVATVRPVRIATCSRPGRRGRDPGQPPQRAPGAGVDRAAAAVARARASVPSKSATTSSGRCAMRRSRPRRSQRRRAAPGRAVGRAVARPGVRA